MSECEWCEGDYSCKSFGPARGMCPGYACTRPEGHPGKHVVCIPPYQHNIQQWSDKE